MSRRRARTRDEHLAALDARISKLSDEASGAPSSLLRTIYASRLRTLRRRRALPLQYSAEQ